MSTDEIIIIEDWREVWWDMDSDREYMQAVTGTFGKFPNVQRRRIQNVFGKKIHRLDSGEVHTRWSTRWEGSKSFTSFWEECAVCGTKFNLRLE